MANTNLSNAAAIVANDSIVDLLDGGSGAGYVRIYDDGAAQPSSVDDAVPAGSTMLSEHTLSDPAFGGSVDAAPNAVATANAIADATAAASGTATWFRAFDSAGNAVIDGDVSVDGGSGDMTINATDIAQNATVSVTSWTFGHNE